MMYVFAPSLLPVRSASVFLYSSAIIPGATILSNYAMDPSMKVPDVWILLGIAGFKLLLTYVLLVTAKSKVDSTGLITRLTRWCSGGGASSDEVASKVHPLAEDAFDAGRHRLTLQAAAHNNGALPANGAHTNGATTNGATNGSANGSAHPPPLLATHSGEETKQSQAQQRLIGSAPPAFALVYDQITCHIALSSGLCREPETRKVLNGVSGIIYPGVCAPPLCWMQLVMCFRLT
jgi:hypothetical protein